MKLDDIDIYNLYWANEFDYEPVVQAQIRSVTGALINFEQAQPVGQTMTLTGAWVSRTTLLALQAKRTTANNTIEVKLDDGRIFTTIFDRSKTPSLEAVLIDGIAANPEANDQYSITLNLQIIAQIN